MQTGMHDWQRGKRRQPQKNVPSGGRRGWHGHGRGMDGVLRAHDAAHPPPLPQPGLSLSQYYSVRMSIADLYLCFSVPFAVRVI